jgi:hypothetical protein
LAGTCITQDAGTYPVRFSLSCQRPPLANALHYYCFTATAADSKEYAFEMATSTIRFGPGSTAEVGFDLANLGVKNVMLVTDAHLATLSPVKTAMNSLTRAGVRYTLYSDVRVEPTDTSVKVLPPASPPLCPCTFIRSISCACRQRSLLLKPASLTRSLLLAAARPWTLPRLPTCTPRSQALISLTLSMLQLERACLYQDQ